MNEETQSALERMRAAREAAETAVEQGGGQPWSAELVQFLSSSLLLFSFAALILASVLLWRSKGSPQDILRIFGIIAIIGVSGLLLVTGYSNDQLTPIVGLFGAIAGYLLGKGNQESATK